MSFSCAQYIISALEIQYGFIDLCISECDYALLIALAAWASSFTYAVTDKVIGELTSIIHERSLPLGG